MKSTCCDEHLKTGGEEKVKDRQEGKGQRKKFSRIIKESPGRKLLQERKAEEKQRKGKGGSFAHER